MSTSREIRKHSPIAEHFARHGDGVRSIALWVDDARRSWEETVRRGAVSFEEPRVREDEYGRAVVASIAIYGDTLHSFVERGAHNGPFLPCYRAVANDPAVRSVALLHIDHCVGNVGWNAMNTWVKFYEEVMGFGLYQHFDDNDISTEYSALMSKVMANGNGYVKFPINEPAEDKRRSQIEEVPRFLWRLRRAAHRARDRRHSRYGGPYAAARLPNSSPSRTRITPSCKAVSARSTRMSASLSSLAILVDRDDEGYMLQIFTRPVHDQPTLFFEIIQRKGSRSFGKSNFKALFEAIEREQAMRGNL